MNLDLRVLMASRADSVEPPVLDPLAVVADGERLVRSRRRLTAAAAALALAVTVGTATVVLDRSGERLAPTDPIEWAPGTRPLTWGEGQTIHLGDRTVDTGMDFLSLDVTDDGAAFTTLDGDIWFTDGSRIEQIGETHGGIGIDSQRYGRPRERVVNDNAGSLLAWIEYPNRRDGAPELVVFDTGQGAVVARTPRVDDEGFPYDRVAAVAGRQVFVSVDFGSNLLRYDLDSGTFDEVRPAVLEAARRDGPRALVVGSSPQDGRLNPDELYGTIPVTDSRLDGLFDAHTGELLDLELSPGYRTGHLNVYFLQWLDDDRFTVGSSADGSGDLLICRIGAGRCTVTVESGSWTSTTYPGRKAPLQPGHGGVGAELAMGRAMQAAQD